MDHMRPCGIAYGVLPGIVQGRQGDRMGKPGTMMRLRHWISLTRPAFFSVGVLPYLLGAIIAWHDTGMFRIGIFLAGMLGAVLIMLAAYLAGEYWDIAEDRISAGLPRSRFAGGSGMVADGFIPARHALTGAFLSLALAAVVGILLYFVGNTGPWTVPLGMIGMVGGFCYSSRPVRWVASGTGELWIAFCYGWLPVATGYYLQAGAFTPLVCIVSLPLALTIFNAILVNEFPDHRADSSTSKRNLVVRLGLQKASVLYAAIAVASWPAWLVSVGAGVPPLFLGLQAPFLAISAILAVQMVRGAWTDPVNLEWLCGGTLLVDLGIAAVYIVSFLSGRM